MSEISPRRYEKSDFVYYRAIVFCFLIFATVQKKVKHIVDLIIKYIFVILLLFTIYAVNSIEELLVKPRTGNWNYLVLWLSQTTYFYTMDKWFVNFWGWAKRLCLVHKRAGGSNYQVESYYIIIYIIECITSGQIKLIN